MTDRPPPERPGSRTRPLTVSELNEGADALLREGLGPLWIVGEIGRFVAHRSGHWYFQLRDAERATVSCAMFRGRNARVRFRPEDGMEVLALATPGVYVPSGRYQLIVEALEPRGAGAAALALEQLRRRLAAEGLFDEARKKPLPHVPSTIGVVTSRDGAALRDVLRVLRRRFPGVRVVLSAAAVQGERAPEDLVAALFALDAFGPDVILLVRGGGAREDLAAFDDERVVRAVAMCRTPVVTGIGHEIDLTLADLAADRRAATPSAAAEIVVRGRAELLDMLAGLRTRLERAMRAVLARDRLRLARAAGSAGVRRVPRLVDRRRLQLAELSTALAEAIGARLRGSRRAVADLAARLHPDGQRRRIDARRQRVRQARVALAGSIRRVLERERALVARQRARLDALSPLAVLGRGYALVRHRGRVVRDAARLAPGDRIDVTLARGALAADVAEVRADDAGRRAGRECGDDHGRN
ncbi:MAG: exodeoxyribonuclease VII large subunit [Acidobacteria bacterium]|nr:MAG: exodeoxyribonuclease VII large subunit [Acidobacteriota bacterium]